MTRREEIIPEGPGLEIKFIHAAGPGGQNVNKVATAVQLRFNPALYGLPEPQIRRLRERAGRRFNQDGELVITARNRRSQSANRQEAFMRLRELLVQAAMPPPRSRRATKPDRAAVERRLTGKKRRSRLKTGRRSSHDFEE